MRIHSATSIAAVLVASAFCEASRAEYVAPSAQLEQTLAAEARGVVRTVEDGGFVLRMEEGELAVRVSERTQYTLDGEPAERSEVLRAGARVVVTHEAGMASKVAATSEGAIQALAPESLRGQVRSVEDDAFVVTHGEETTRVRTTRDTEYRLDGEIAPRNTVLAVGNAVVVEHADGVATRVEAQSSQATAAVEVVRGTVGDVTDDGFTLTTQGEPLHVRVNDRTKYLLDGEPAERSAVVKAGQVVSVEHTDGLATSVSAMSSR